uniref:Uncharacterized protein n=1 Tax=Ananas comosus var. bracteatus TaxID=296719 RepID=A0A6V7QTM7_ANACO
MNNERNKVVYDLDLNSPPADNQEGNLISQDDAVSAATSGAVNSHPLPNIGSYCTPIIVDSDEADMLSAPTGFPQMRNPSTSSMMTIVFDEDVEIINPRQSVNVTKDPPATSPLFTDNKCESVPPNTTLMNCGHLQDTDAARSPKKRNVTRPTQEPAKVVSNEPNDEPAKVVPKKNKELPKNDLVKKERSNRSSSASSPESDDDAAAATEIDHISLPAYHSSTIFPFLGLESDLAVRGNWIGELIIEDAEKLTRLVLDRSEPKTSLKIINAR